jgi:hypothetical protein
MLIIKKPENIKKQKLICYSYVEFIYDLYVKYNFSFKTKYSNTNLLLLTTYSFKTNHTKTKPTF